MVETENMWIKFGLRFCRSGLKEESKDMRVGSKFENERKDRNYRAG